MSRSHKNIQTFTPAAVVFGLARCFLAFIVIGLASSAFAHDVKVPECDLRRSRCQRFPGDDLRQNQGKNRLPDDVRAGEPRGSRPLVNSDPKAGRFRQGSVADIPGHISLRHALRGFGHQRQGLTCHLRNILPSRRGLQGRGVGRANGCLRAGESRSGGPLVVETAPAVGPATGWPTLPA